VDEAEVDETHADIRKVDSLYVDETASDEAQVDKDEVLDVGTSVADVVQVEDVDAASVNETTITGDVQEDEEYADIDDLLADDDEEEMGQEDSTIMESRDHTKNEQNKIVKNQTENKDQNKIEDHVKLHHQVQTEDCAEDVKNETEEDQAWAKAKALSAHVRVVLVRLEDQHVLRITAHNLPPDMSPKQTAKQACGVRTSVRRGANQHLFEVEEEHESRLAAHNLHETSPKLSAKPSRSNVRSPVRPGNARCLFEVGEEHASRVAAHNLDELSPKQSKDTGSARTPMRDKATCLICRELAKGVGSGSGRRLSKVIYIYNW
jgi:hypothetical protein